MNISQIGSSPQVGMKIKMLETTTKTITPPIIMDIGNKALEDEFRHQNGSCSTSMIAGERKHPGGNQQITSRSK